MESVFSAKPDITARGTTVEVHVLDVPNIRRPGHRHVQTYRRVITQPDATAVIMHVPVKASVQVQHIVQVVLKRTVPVVIRQIHQMVKRRQQNVKSVYPAVNI